MHCLTHYLVSNYTFLTNFYRSSGLLHIHYHLIHCKYYFHFHFTSKHFRNYLSNPSIGLFLSYFACIFVLHLRNIIHYLLCRYYFIHFHSLFKCKFTVHQSISTDFRIIFIRFHFLILWLFSRPVYFIRLKKTCFYFSSIIFYVSFSPIEYYYFIRID